MNLEITLEFWARFFGRVAVETALVALLAAGVQRWTKSAGWRRTIWQTALLGMVLLLAGELTGVNSAMAGWSRLPITPKQSISAPPALKTAAAAAAATTTAIIATGPAELPVTPSVQTPGPEPAQSATAVWWPAGIWVLGVLVVMTGVIAPRLLFWRLWRRWEQAVTDERLLRCVGTLAGQLGIRRPVRVIERPALSGPVAFGWWRPTVGLPGNLEADFTPAQQEAMLAHELAHLAAHDPAWQFLADLACALLWWQPLAWWSRSRLLSASEMAADEASQLLAHGPGTLAECLVVMGRRLSQPAAGGWQRIEGRGFRSHLGRRVERLLDLPEHPSPSCGPARRWLGILGGLIAVSVLVVTSVAWLAPSSLAGDLTAPKTWRQSWQGSLAAWTLTAAVMPQTTAGVTIRGRVIYEDGQPAAATVKALSPAMGNAQWHPQTLLRTTPTDAQGKFQLQVPAAEMLYWIIATDNSFSTTSKFVISGEGDDIELRLGRVELNGKLDGTISRADGRPAAGLELTLLSEYGTEFKSKTLADGTFRFAQLPGIGQGILLARRGSEVLPLMPVRPASLPPGKLTLVPSGKLQGTVVDGTTQAPVPAAKVTIRPWFSSGMRRTAETDAAGSWAMADLPPGEYIVEVDHPDFGVKSSAQTPPSDQRWLVKQGTSNPVTLPVSPKAMASVSGLIVNRDAQPVPGAVVALPVIAGSMHPSAQIRWFRTDAQGRFTLKTGQLGQSLTLTAFDGLWGLKVIHLPPLSESERREGLRIELPGSVRVKGRVTDDTGKVIEGIRITPPQWLSSSASVPTDPDGRFDLGRLSLPAEPNQKLTLAIRGRGPGGLGHVTRVNETLAKPNPQKVAGRTFYQDTSITVEGTPGQVVETQVIMKQAELLTFEGRVTEATGAPPLNGAVYVFSGTPDESWKQSLPARSGGLFFAHNWHLLAGAQCDADGRFTVHTLRHEGETTEAGLRYSLGIAVNGRARQLVTNVVVPLDSRRRALDIELGPY